MKKILSYSDFLTEESKGLWHNIRKKRAEGRKPARKGSKAYKKAVAAAREIREGLDESYKPIGLPEEQVHKPGVLFYISPGMVKINQQDHGMEVEEIIEYIVESTKMGKGEIYISEDEFIVSGIDEEGNVFYAEQQGEFDQYGGPYQPEMEKPVFIFNGKDVSEEVLKILEDFFVGTKNPDITNVEAWGHLIRKGRGYFSAKKYGL